MILKQYHEILCLYDFISASKIHFLGFLGLSLPCLCLSSVESYLSSLLLNQQCVPSVKKVLVHKPINQIYSEMSGQISEPFFIFYDVVSAVLH